MGRLFVVGVVCLLAAACSQGDRAPTGASVPTVAFTARGTIAIARRGSTVRLPAAVTGSLTPGLALSRAGRGSTGDAGGAGGALLPLLAVRGNARPLFALPGSFRRVVTFHDDTGGTHHLVALYDAAGGPPRVLQHYVGNRLVHLTAMEWRRVNGGWVQQRVLAREIRNDSLVLEADARADAIDVAMARPAGVRRVASLMAVARLGARVAHALAPRDAVAQLYVSECWAQYKEYWKATAALTSAILAIEAGEETGLGPAAINALYFAYSAALAWAGMAEMELFVCVENARERDNPISASDPSIGGTTGSDIGGAGIGIGASPPTHGCLAGSYAADCQTQFGL